MSDDDIDKRVRELEKKAALATGVALVFAAWFGATNFYYIPKAAKEAAQDATSGQTEAEIRKLRDKAQADSDQVAKIADGGKIIIGGKCYKPRMLNRCLLAQGGEYVWFEIDQDCKPPRALKASKLVLAQCDD